MTNTPQKDTYTPVTLHCGQCFTAAQIAKALGCTKQNVHLRLVAIPADTHLPIHGNAHNLAKAWKLESLPVTMVKRLATIAENTGYASVGDLISSPFERFEPPFPLANVAPTAIEKARKLRTALAEILPLRNDRGISKGRLVESGLAAYERCFGYKISERHWRTLFRRTIERDKGTEEWQRIELYLEKTPARRLPARNRPLGCRKLEVLESAIATLATLSLSNVQRKTFLWAKACDQLQLEIENGAGEKQTKRAVLGVLEDSGLVGSDRETLRRNLNRQWAAFRASNGKLVDRRTTRDQRVALPDDDRAILLARTVDCGGRVSQAFREVRDQGELSTQTLERTIANPLQKSYVPARIRRALGNRRQIKPLLTLHRSERDFELTSAHNTRDYSGLFAGDSYQADDCTCPVYYWEPDYTTATGYRIIRGQLIVLIDERTLLVLGYALHSERNYNARIIRALITRVHDEWGLPRRRFYFEKGIWRDSKILTGGKNGAAAGFDVPIEHTEIGLREFGISFVHAKYPRGKVIERVLGLVQNEMERVPGYAGRNEREERHHRVQQRINQANAGQIHPSTFLMDRDQWLSALSALIEKCNSERRNGRLLNGLSSLEAWNALQPPEGQVHLGEKARVILAEHRLKMRVQRNGITLRSSLGGGTYCGEGTGELRGRDVLVWVNPEDLTAIGITSLDRKEGPFVVPRLEPLPAIDATPEQFAASKEQISAHNQPTRTAYRLISPHLALHNFRRLHFVDRRTSEIGAALKQQKAALTQERQRVTRLVNKAHQQVRQRGLNIKVDTKNAERAAAAAGLVEDVYGDINRNE